MKEMTYHVPEMHCAACENSVRKALGLLPGVKDVHVDPNSRHVTVQFDDHQTDILSIKRQIERAGFDVA